MATIWVVPGFWTNPDSYCWLYLTKKGYPIISHYISLYPITSPLIHIPILSSSFSHAYKSNLAIEIHHSLQMIFTFKCTCAGKSHLAMFDYRRYLSYNIIYISGGCSKSQNANFWKVNPLYPRCVYKYICTYIYIFIFYVHVHVHIYIYTMLSLYIYILFKKKKKLFSW